MNPWTEILAIIEPRLSPDNFRTWFAATEFDRLVDGTLYVRVPNATYRDWLMENYRQAIAAAAAKLEQVNRVEFIAPAETTSGHASQPELFETGVRKSSPLNPCYTFDSFVAGASNELAAAASQRVAEDPAGSYNPLFIYGGVGLGKTHLLHAIANAIAARQPSWNVCYISAERFMNEFIESISRDSAASFRKWIRNVDVLLVDDVQLLARGERTQEEFFHTFNSAYESRKQIVLTSDVPPKAIKLQERLQSRFEWGLLADVISPDLEVRNAILLKKAEQLRFDLPHDVALYIAEQVKDNVRILESCLLRLIAHREKTGEEITPAVAGLVLASMLPEARLVELRDIERVVCKRYRVHPRDLKVRSNAARIVEPRQVAMWMARELTDLSLADLALAFGNMDHSTVSYSVKRVAARIRADREFSREMSVVCSEVTA